MPTTSSNARRAKKVERSNLRLTSSQRQIITGAAKRKNRSLSEFMVTSSLERALQIYAESNPSDLSAEERDSLAEMVMNPPEPSDRLRALFDRFSPVQEKR